MIIKHPPAQNPRALAQIPAHIIAGIAAQLQSTEADPVERVRQAYTLLDIAESGRYGLEKQRCFHAGLMEYCEERTLDDFWEKRRTDPLSVFGKEGEQVPVDFETALSKIFGRSVKKKDRETRLALYIQSQWLDPAKRLQETMDESQQANLKRSGFVIGKATDIISDYKKYGIPFEVLCDICDALPGWWKARYSETQSAKRKGKPKGEQARVVRRNDKRRGSRPQNILRKI